MDFFDQDNYFMMNKGTEKDHSAVWCIDDERSYLLHLIAICLPRNTLARVVSSVLSPLLKGNDRPSTIAVEAPHISTEVRQWDRAKVRHHDVWEALPLSQDDRRNMWRRSVVILDLGFSGREFLGMKSGQTQNGAYIPAPSVRSVCPGDKKCLDTTC